MYAARASVASHHLYVCVATAFRATNSVRLTVLPQWAPHENMNHHHHHHRTWLRRWRLFDLLKLPCRPAAGWEMNRGWPLAALQKGTGQRPSRLTEVCTGASRPARPKENSMEEDTRPGRDVALTTPQPQPQQSRSGTPEISSARLPLGMTEPPRRRLLFRCRRAHDDLKTRFNLQTL